MARFASGGHGAVENSMILEAVSAASPQPRRAWQTIMNRTPTDYAEALARPSTGFRTGTAAEVPIPAM